MTASPDEEGIAARLLRWYDVHRRDLPWRRQPSPYRTLVSEFMLQQTVVATVEPYFARWMARFPGVAALAAADEDEVLALWSGLGYYARARNLHKVARLVVAEQGGRLPEDEAALRKLPGVGAYTAAAVAAIGFGARAFALDGNAARVMARLLAERQPVDSPAVRRRLHAYGLAQVPRGRAGDFNQAVMELGALVCVPRRPRCASCPLRARCLAGAQELAATIPVKRAKPARAVVRVVCAYVSVGGRVWLERRPAGQLLAGTWALPSAPLPDVAEGEAARTAAQLAAARGGLRVGSQPPRFRGRVRQIFTHRDLTAEIYEVPIDEARATAGRLRDDDGHRWVDAVQLEALGVSSFARKTLRVATHGDGAASGEKSDRAGVRP